MNDFSSYSHVRQVSKAKWSAEDLQNFKTLEGAIEKYMCVTDDESPAKRYKDELDEELEEDEQKSKWSAHYLKPIIKKGLSYLHIEVFAYLIDPLLYVFNHHNCFKVNGLKLYLYL